MRFKQITIGYVSEFDKFDRWIDLIQREFLQQKEKEIVERGIDEMVIKEFEEYLCDTFERQLEKVDAILVEYIKKDKNYRPVIGLYLDSCRRVLSVFRELRRNVSKELEFYREMMIKDREKWERVFRVREEVKLKFYTVLALFCKEEDFQSWLYSVCLEFVMEYDIDEVDVKEKEIREEFRKFFYEEIRRLVGHNHLLLVNYKGIFTYIIGPVFLVDDAERVISKMMKLRDTQIPLDWLLKSCVEMERG